MNIISDNHTHTSNSLDSECPIEEMYAQACALGLKYYTVTDHCEINEYYSAGYDKIVRNSVAQTIALQKKYSTSPTKLLVGVELGEPVENLAYTDDVFSVADFDFVLGSIHSIRGHEDFYFLDYTNADVDSYLKIYFDEIIEMLEWGKIDCVSHLTYPLRYICGEHGLKVDLDKYATQIEEIFKLIIKTQKALEINTSGFRQKIGTSMPHFELIQQYKTMGGKYITVGSDAHYKEHIGMGILQGYDLLKKAGFDEITIFEKRNPILHKL